MLRVKQGRCLTSFLGCPGPMLEGVGSAGTCRHWAAVAGGSAANFQHGEVNQQMRYSFPFPLFLPPPLSLSVSLSSPPYLSLSLPGFWPLQKKKKYRSMYYVEMCVCVHACITQGRNGNSWTGSSRAQGACAGSWQRGGRGAAVRQDQCPAGLPAVPRSTCLYLARWHLSLLCTGYRTAQSCNVC